MQFEFMECVHVDMKTRLGGSLKTSGKLPLMVTCSFLSVSVNPVVAMLMTGFSCGIAVGVSCVGFCVALCSCHSGFSDFVSVYVSGLTKLL